MKQNKKRLFIVMICIMLLTPILIIPNNVEATTYTQTVKQGIENFPLDYQEKLLELQELYPNWKFTAYYTGLTWGEFMAGENSRHYTNSVHKNSNSLWKCDCGILKSGYVCASKAITAFYADPRNFLGESSIFQFLEMSYNENVHTEEAVKGIIASSFMNSEVTFVLNGEQTTMAYSAIIMEAAKQSGISPYSIAIKIFQEVGRGGSSSVSGMYTAANGTIYSGYYNFFNYGAYDEGDAIENALIYAKKKNWTNQYIAIIEGAKLMANNYINVGQNTAYFYKWDVIGNKTGDFFNHQYMTNVVDPTSQSSSLFNTYATNNLLQASLNFLIPVYEDMPTVNALPTTIDTTLSTSYYVTGTDVRIRQNPSTTSSILAYPAKNEVVTLLEWNAGTANNYEWAKVKTVNGTVGYIANKYLAACNPENNNNNKNDNNNNDENNNNNNDENNNNNNNNENNSNQTPTIEIARIDGEHLIVMPNKTVQEIANYFSETVFSAEKSDQSQIGIDETVGTGYKYTLNDKTYTVIVIGDTNGSGTVDALDALKILKYDVGLTTMEEIYLKAADANRNGTIDSLDALKILKFDVSLTDITI